MRYTAAMLFGLMFATVAVLANRALPPPLFARMTCVCNQQLANTSSAPGLLAISRLHWAELFSISLCRASNKAFISTLITRT